MSVIGSDAWIRNERAAGRHEASTEPTALAGIDTLEAIWPMDRMRVAV